MLLFCNGNTVEDTIVHWCTDGCCDTDSDCVRKLLKVTIPWFGRGFAAPLLYRFKHFGPASSYMKVGLAFHRLLPRTIQHMQGANPSSLDAETSRFLDTLLAEPDTASDRQGGSFTQQDLQIVMGELMDANMDYATSNSIRQKMVCQEIASAGFMSNTFLIDTLLQPFEHGVNFCFARTTLLHQLSALGSSHPKHDELLQKSRARFLDIIRGELGQRLIMSFMDNVKFRLHKMMELGLQGNASMDFLRTAFDLVVVCCTDTWRRMVYDFEQPPWSLFKLIGLSTEEFAQAWTEIIDVFERCPCCVDETFTAVLLAAFPGKLTEETVTRQANVQAAVEGLLLDIAAWCPMTSDLCEIKNGNVQWLVSRRGNTHLKGVENATEATFIQSLLNNYHWVEHVMEGSSMPSKRTSSSILKRVGTAGTNQFTRSHGKDPAPRT